MIVQKLKAWRILKWLTDTLLVLYRLSLLLFKITDDEKFLWKDLKVEESKKMARENMKDIIAVGFDPEKTFMFNDFDYMW